ncbi:hypothetical protein F5Y01DRAFT_294247 [Xylaria sp. FL0043]|nr:hypothetical protein F5Y01DRAFT_294247 [Xylaria sp. FL0043]
MCLHVSAITYALLFDLDRLLGTDTDTYQSMRKTIFNVYDIKSREIGISMYVGPLATKIKGLKWFPWSYRTRLSIYSPGI